MKINTIPLYLLSLLFICFSCKSTKVNDQELNLDQLSPGKREAAVLGKLLDFQQKDDGGIAIKVEVKVSKQGGAGSPNFGEGMNVFGVVESYSVRSYKKQNGRELLSDLQKSKEILFSIKKNNDNKTYSISNIIL